MVAITVLHIFRTTLIICCFLVHIHSAPLMEAKEFAEIDDKHLKILDDPKDNLEWDGMLKNMLNMYQDMKQYINYMKEDNADMVQKAYAIYKNGKPQFIDHTFSEPDVQEFAKVTDKQLMELHRLRDKLDNLWNDFLDILSEKTGETLDYGIHAQYPGYGPDEHGYGGGGYGGGGPGYGDGWNGGRDDGDGFGEGHGGGFRRGYGDDYGRGYSRGRGRGRGRRGGGGGYGGDFGPPYR